MWMLNVDAHRNMSYLDTANSQDFSPHFCHEFTLAVWLLFKSCQVSVLRKITNANPQVFKNVVKNEDPQPLLQHLHMFLFLATTPTFPAIS